MSTTNEENKREETPQNDQQNIEIKNSLDKPSPNLKGTEDTENKENQGSLADGAAVGNDDRREITGDNTRINDNNVSINNNNNNNNNNNSKGACALSKREYEDRVLKEVSALLKAPAFPFDGDEEGNTEADMSRLGPKPKMPNKSISRPSLSHMNQRLPGELSGQPSVKSTKDDSKYWKSREQELLDRIAALESKAASAEAAKEKMLNSIDQSPTPRSDKPDDELNSSSKEQESYKNRLQQIEKELFAKQKEQPKEPNLKGIKTPDEIINHLKAQNEDLRGALAKMTAILRDKTALCVSQEKKVAALTNQVESLKEVVAITKDLLNIRNMEVQHISNDISAMESKIDCERQRHNQMLIKMDEAVKLNSELKKEYENQMKLFQHLRDNYEEKIRMISQSNTAVDEGKESGMESGNAKSTQITGKNSRGSNFKVNFQDT